MLDSMHILAQADGFNAVTVIGLSLHAAEGLFLFWLATNQTNRRDRIKGLEDKIDSAESKRATDVNAIARELHDANTKLLDERDRRVSHSIANHAQNVTTAMNAWELRVKRSEAELEKLTGVRAEAELALTKALNGMREFVRECAPSKSEFSELKTGLKELTQAVDRNTRDTVSKNDFKDLTEQVRRIKNEA